MVQQWAVSTVSNLVQQTAELKADKMGVQKVVEMADP